MHEITDIHDRDLYAPLRRALDSDREPDHMPHLTLVIAPAPAEAATDVGHDEPDNDSSLPEGAGVIISAGIVGAIAALAMVAHWLAGMLL